MDREAFLRQQATPAADILSQELDGETVILDLDREHYFGLDATGTRVWQLISETRDLGEVLRVLQDEFDADETTLIHDLRRIVTDLTQAGLITVTPPVGRAHGQ